MHVGIGMSQLLNLSLIPTDNPERNDQGQARLPAN